VGVSQVESQGHDVWGLGRAQLAHLCLPRAEDVLVLKVSIHGDVSLEPFLADRALEARHHPQPFFPSSRRSGGQLDVSDGSGLSAVVCRQTSEVVRG